MHRKNIVGGKVVNNEKSEPILARVDTHAPCLFKVVTQQRLWLCILFDIHIEICNRRRFLSFWENKDWENGRRIRRGTSHCLPHRWGMDRTTPKGQWFQETRMYQLINLLPKKIKINSLILITFNICMDPSISIYAMILNLFCFCCHFHIMHWTL